MIHHSSILTSAPSRPCDRAFRPVAQLRCTLAPSFLLRSRFLPDFQSETTPTSPSRDPVPPSPHHFQSASRPPTNVSSPSPQH